MNREIKKAVPMLQVEVSFWTKTEFLYFEWTEEALQKALQYDYVYFPLYRRWVLSTKIKDFKSSSIWEKNLNREQKMSSLTEEQKEQVKFFVSNMKKNIWREPTESEFEKMIFCAVHWYLPGEEPGKTESKLWEYWRKKTVEVIKRMRENKKKFWKYKI